LKFTSISISNIFAYYGPSEIDLSECTPEKNIVLVQGANGAGKTSLLNAIKILFVGANDERVRRVIQGQSPISPKQFVLGAPGRWFGLFNRHAKVEGSPAFVAIGWESDGVIYRAERRFLLTLGGTEYNETLTITRGGSPLQDEAAEALLRDLLPPEVVPFFFFDGEQIQSLADARFGREQAEIERLLGLSFVGQLLREIASFEKGKKAAELPDDVRANITKIEGEAEGLEAKAEAARSARNEIESERLDLVREKSRADAERDSLRGGLSDEERQRMEARIDMVAMQREKIALDLATKLPPESPILTNLPLAERAFDMLETALAGSADISLSARLHSGLPDQLIVGLASLQPAVTLDDQQQHDFRDQVSGALEASGVSQRPATIPVLQSLSPRRLKDLRDQFYLWRESGPDTVARQADQLKTLRTLLHEERTLRKDLHEAEITSEDARERFVVLSDDIDRLDMAINEAVARGTAREIEEASAQREAAERRAVVEDLYVLHADLVAQNRAYHFAKRVKLALEAFKDERRKQIRASVESRLNSHVEVLLARSQLVRGVSLSDQFSITYLDEDGDDVARHSLSAGMRQLAAMAMLWALKDEANRPLPVVIDTPLGRIDSENRNLLMDEYFPNAGNPLILLPTNSEIGSEGYDQLVEHVAKRYVIDNLGGTRAQLAERPLDERREAV